VRDVDVIVQNKQLFIGVGVARRRLQVTK